jgi:bacteriorhodopsin
MELVLQLGIGVFSLSSLWFLNLEKGKAFKSGFLVSFITLISYILMFEGGLLGVSSSGADLYWTRWFMYGFSCSLLMYTICQDLKFDREKTMMQIYLTVIVMMSGALASVMEGFFMLAVFGVSTIAYIMMIAPILKSKAEKAKFVKPFILLGWSIFPIFFILSPEGYGLIANVVAAWAYLVLDFGTKIVFYQLDES